MRYLCLNCEERFEHDDKGKLRCPKCLRVTGLEKIESGAVQTAQAAKNPYLVPGVIAVALAAIVGVYAVWHSNAPEQVGDDVPMRPLSQGTLAGHLRRLRADAGELASLLEANDAIEGFATRAASDRDETMEIAEGVQQALRTKANERHFVRWSLGVPRDTAPGTAAEAYEDMREAGGAARLYPIEVAAVAVSALRSRGVPAMVAEIHRFPGDGSPPDPSGQMGYYGVAVYEDEPGEGTPRIFDPWGGHESEPEEDDFRVLDDVEAVGAAVNLRALHLLVRENDPERALETSSEAIRLLPRSPAVRAVRGAILLVAGNPNEALAELEAAQQIRADGPRRNLIAGLHMAREDLDAAQREASAALEEFPDYAHAHATLAAIHMAQSEPDLARAELDAAEHADPDLYILPALRASFYAAQGDLERAVTEIQRAVEVNPDFNTRLAAAQIYRQAGRYDDMRREAAAVLELVPEARRDQLRELLSRRLGASAFEEEEEITDEELAAIEAEGEGSGELTLRAPEIVTSAPEEGADDESLDDEPIEDEGADEGAEGEEGPALMLGDRSHFTLGGGSLSLQ
ncbi:MAG: tetratricopeptide repeat protein [Deltaproteobacteria bacterium]|nr:tetratricopeptide repeat protein [Deltaproteobacteria bacterium]